MRCKACNVLYQSHDWKFDKAKNEHDELCLKCRNIAHFATLQENKDVVEQQQDEEQRVIREVLHSRTTRE